MNSFRFRSKSSVNLGLAFGAGLLLASPAFSQTLPPVPAPVVQPQPTAVVPAPVVPNAIPNPAMIQSPVASSPERKIALPTGASISDAASRVRNIAAEAGKSLDELVGTGLSPREQFDVDAISERQRRIMLLKNQLEEAKLAKQIWQELHGKDSAEGEGNAEKLKKLEEEKSFLEKRLREAQERDPQVAGSDGSNDVPVVASITGGSGSASARILIPYSGVVTAVPGMTLPNGMKVTSISQSGVVVSKSGNSFTLPYGSSVPRFKTPAKAAQGAGIGSQLQFQR